MQRRQTPIRLREEHLESGFVRDEGKNEGF
jgi:hypothetical protein